mgnify:CR=1 FL=1
MPSHAALAKAGSSAGKRGDPGEAREARDADHRRDQDEAIGPRQLLVVERIERVFHRQRAAVGEAHDVERLRRVRHAACASRTARRVAASQSSHSTSVKRGRNGAMGRHPDRHRDEAVVAIAARDVAQAVGRIGEPVQQDDRADRRPVGLENVGAVPVLREVAGIDRAAVVVAVARDAGFGVELVGDFGPHAAEDRLLGLEVGRPVGLVDLVGVHVVRHVGVHGSSSGPRCESQARATSSVAATTISSTSTRLRILNNLAVIAILSIRHREPHARFGTLGMVLGRVPIKARFTASNMRE